MLPDGIDMFMEGPNNMPQKLWLFNRSISCLAVPLWFHYSVWHVQANPLRGISCNQESDPAQIKSTQKLLAIIYSFPQ